MELQPTGLPEVILVKPRVFGDSRGFFFESWHARKFADAGLVANFVQDNHSRSVRGTLRGLHYQLTRPQGKIVRVTRGEVFDVVVDIRRSSPRFGQWASVVLSETNQHMLWMPPGFAHGYLALSDVADLLYKCTDFHDASDERAIRWNDAALNVQWPLAAGQMPTLSARDVIAPLFAEADTYE